MKFNFDKKTNDFLRIITKNAQSQNLRVFFVGGIVRDKILNIVLSGEDKNEKWVMVNLEASWNKKKI